MNSLWNCCRVPVLNPNLPDPITLHAGSEAYYWCWYSSYARWTPPEMLAERSCSKTNLCRDCGYTELYKRGVCSHKKLRAFPPFYFVFFFFTRFTARWYGVLCITRGSQVDLTPGGDEVVDAPVLCLVGRPSFFFLVCSGVMTSEYGQNSLLCSFREVLLQIF